MDFQNFNLFVSKKIKDYKIPGLSIAIISKEKELYKNSFGKVNISSDIKITDNTLFRIGSLTKPIVATAVMKLVESKKLDLDSPIESYLDNFSFKNEKFRNSITVRKLLTHTAGFYDSGKLLAPNYSLKNLAYDISQSDPVVDIGDFSYSNNHYGMIGYIIESVTKASFENWMQENIFLPLGMNDTTFSKEEVIKKEVAFGHLEDYDRRLNVIEELGENPSNNPSFYLFSTLNDMIKFTSLYLSEKNDYISDDFFKQLIDSVGSKQDFLSEFSLSFGIKYQNGKRYLEHHGVVSNGFSSYIAIYPDDNLAIIILMNRVSDFIYDIIEEINTNYLGEDYFNFNLRYLPYIKKYSIIVGKYLGNSVGSIEIFEEKNKLILLMNKDSFNLSVADNFQYFVKDETGEVIISIFLDKNMEKIFIDGEVAYKVDKFNSLNSLNIDGIYKHPFLNSIEIFTETLDSGEKVFIISDDSIENELFFIKENSFFAYGYNLIIFDIDKDGSILGFQEEGFEYYSKIS